MVALARDRQAFTMLMFTPSPGTEKQSSGVLGPLTLTLVAALIL
jgi:hypothetical protein